MLVIPTRNTYTFPDCTTATALYAIYFNFADGNRTIEKVDDEDNPDNAFTRSEFLEGLLRLFKKLLLLLLLQIYLIMYWILHITNLDSLADVKYQKLKELTFAEKVFPISWCIILFGRHTN